MKRKLLKISLSIIAIGLIYCCILVYPDPLFSNTYEYHQFKIYSNKLIPKEIEFVLEDVEKRISNSELYSENQKFQIFLCNKNWEYFIFSRNTNSGGVCNFSISKNIFIRKCDIKTNQIIPPISWKFSLEDRPMSYFIAHELIHSMQSEIDRFMNVKVSNYLLEGYADYVAKSTEANIEEYWIKFYENDPIMNPENGLYNKYHLFIDFLINQKGYSFFKIIEVNPKIELLEKLKNENDH